MPLNGAPPCAPCEQCLSCAPSPLLATNLNHDEESRDGQVWYFDDLLLRKPKGQKGVKPEYNIVEYYCYDAHKNKKRVECDHPGWGYPDETLWDLGFRCESDIREYVFANFYRDDSTNHEYYLTSGQRAGVTRKTNRLYGRINSALRRVRGSGNIPGLYQVSVGYGKRFYFFGDSSVEIKSLASMMLSPIYPDDHFDVTFIDRAVPGDILDKNVPSFEKMDREVKSKRERAAALVKEAEQMESQAEYVKTLITQNLEVAMRAT